MLLTQSVPDTVASWWTLVSAIAGGLIATALAVWRGSRYFNKLEQSEERTKRYSDNTCLKISEKYEEDFESVKTALRILQGELNGFGERVNRLSDVSLHHQDRFVQVDKEVINLKNTDILNRKDIDQLREDYRLTTIRVDRLTDVATNVRVELARKGVEIKFD